MTGDARAVLDGFLAAFTAADVEGILDLFWPDALVWGTTMIGLATGPEAVHAYFAPVGRRAPGERAARWSSGTSLAVSDTVALISGAWTVGPGVGADGTVLPLRLSLTLLCRDGAWRIAAFHSSPMPG
ncbi:YybH family protein [Pararoseomonas indoligenes]|uniref:Nuclear transport factor 2 family protein n=1 Tax=Roseomonas indoligenes TaxID=2820811 RepID=A0A940N1M4_9PROT|nr:nuclear transport factor 2 family protein [Pararoseomonas indoligenes]MBP0496296.1 nuclear transport factor 2 family protein [Pararoseomonas indoligenes]